MIKRILGQWRQKRILNNIRHDVERKAKTGTPDIDIITVDNKDLFMVCPSCFDISKALRPGYAVQREICSYCGSEGADIDLIPVNDYLRKNSSDQLEGLFEKVSGQDNLMNDWKNMMLKGVEKLIELKKRCDE